MLEFEVIPTALLLLLSLLSPFVVAAINRSQWSSKTRELVAAGVAIVIAVAWLALTGAISDWSNLAVAVPAVYTLQSLLYRFILKEWAIKFEVITTPGGVALAPAENPDHVLVTASETIKIAEKNPAVDPIQEVEAPLEVTTEAQNQPKG